jgi:hypothetical protein
MEERSMTETKIIAIDLDGTLARYDGWKGLDKIGDPLPGAVEMVNALVREEPDGAWDNEVIVFTTRTNPLVNLEPDWKLRERIEKWLEHWGFSDKIKVYAGPGKPLADLYIDDRAFYHPTNQAWTMREVRAINGRLGVSE